MKKRLYHLDYLRFLSFGLIIFYHMIIQLALDGVREEAQVSFLYANANMHIAIVGVNLFFMISGAGLMLSSKDKLDIPKYFKRRFTRILIPFYIVWGIYFLQKMLAASTPFTPRPPFWTIFFTIGGMDEYWRMAGIHNFSLGVGEWFLGCIVMMYIIFPLLHFIVKKQPLITGIAATVYYLLITWFYPFETVPAHMNFLTKIYPFILGMVLVCIKREIPRWTILITFPACILFLVLKSPLPLPAEWKGIIFALAIYLFFAALNPLLSHARMVNACMLLFSKYSYEIFLVHHIVIYTVMELVRGQILSVKNIAIVILTELLGMAFGGYLLKRIEEFFPFNKPGSKKAA